MVTNKKKKLFILLFIVILVTILIIVGYGCVIPVYEVRIFSIEDYSYALSYEGGYEGSFLGKIDNATEARNAAVKVFREVYYDNIFSITPPYIVSYDNRNDIWLVQAGSYFYPESGAHIIIKASNGEILCLWNYKF